MATSTLLILRAHSKNLIDDSFLQYLCFACTKFGRQAVESMTSVRTKKRAHTAYMRLKQSVHGQPQDLDAQKDVDIQKAICQKIQDQSSCDVMSSFNCLSSVNGKIQ